MSEQQEYYKCPTCGFATLYKPYADAHEAAIAAERAKREQAEADLFNSANIAAENVKLHAQLAAEREAHAKTAKQLVDSVAIEGSEQEKRKTLAHAFESERDLRKRYEDKHKALVALCDEVATWHRDKDSPDYNECEKDPCAWCEALAKVKEGK